MATVLPDPLPPIPRRFSIRLPRPLWIGLGMVVLVAIWCVAPTLRLHALCSALSDRDAERILQLEGLMHDPAFVAAEAIRDPVRSVKYTPYQLTIADVTRGQRYVEIWFSRGSGPWDKECMIVVRCNVASAEQTGFMW